MRILEGRVLLVGVAGRTLTEWCGERAPRGVLLTASEPVDEVEDALEWEWW